MKSLTNYILNVYYRMMLTDSKGGLIFSIIFTYVWVLFVIVYTSYKFISIYPTIPILTLITLLPFALISISVFTSELVVISIQKQSYRRKKIYKDTIFYKDRNRLWKIQTHSNDRSLDSIISDLKSRGYECEIGGYTSEQKRP